MRTQGFGAEAAPSPPVGSAGALLAPLPAPSIAGGAPPMAVEPLAGPVVGCGLVSAPDAGSDAGDAGVAAVDGVVEGDGDGVDAPGAAVAASPWGAAAGGEPRSQPNSTAVPRRVARIVEAHELCGVIGSRPGCRSPSPPTVGCMVPHQGGATIGANR